MGWPDAVGNDPGGVSPAAGASHNMGNQRSFSKVQGNHGPDEKGTDCLRGEYDQCLIEHKPIMDGAHVQAETTCAIIF